MARPSRHCLTCTCNIVGGIDEPRSHSRSDDPSTSHAAAEQNTTAAAHKVALAEALTEHGENGASRLSEITGIYLNECRRRLSDLKKDGVAYPTHKLVLSMFNRSERVWRIGRGPATPAPDPGLF